MKISFNTQDVCLLEVCTQTRHMSHQTSFSCFKVSKSSFSYRVWMCSGLSWLRKESERFCACAEEHFGSKRCEKFLD